MPVPGGGGGGMPAPSGGGGGGMPAPIGGGGMISGTCLTLTTLAPETKVIAAEPEQADDAYRSFKAGHIIADDAPKTIADGLLVPLKDLTWHFVSNHVHDMYTASETEIVDAMKIIWKHLRVVMEPSSAVPLATILKRERAAEACGRAVGDPHPARKEAARARAAVISLASPPPGREIDRREREGDVYSEKYSGMIVVKMRMESISYLQVKKKLRKKNGCGKMEIL